MPNALFILWHNRLAPTTAFGAGGVRCNNVERMVTQTSPVVAAARLVILAIVLAEGAAPAWAQDEPVVRLTCGGFEAVPSGVGSAGKPTRLSIQKNGRLLQTISDWSITRVDCADFNGDKTFELLVTSFSGGAHCCETLRVWALESSPRQILEYESGNASGFELRDLNGDGRMELVVGDDSFAYFDDLCYACSPSQLPFVACATDSGFEDCTKRFPDLLRSSMARYVDRLRASGAGTDVKEIEGAALGVLAMSVLLGEEDAGIEIIRKAVANGDVMTWIGRARPQVRDWAQARGRRLKNRRQ
jgi:hypothetical protein